jgi:peptidoglycan/LPS O-acetylase OafA/YrhL
MVFVWHFCHGPVPYATGPAFPFASMFDEGHTGVSLFMTLSGYLFAKLLDGKRVRYRAFFWNRALRLLPLLLLVLASVGVQKVSAGEETTGQYLRRLAHGLVVLPNLPNGTWSIVVEIQFYLLLPLILWLLRKSSSLPLIVLMTAIALRTGWYFHKGAVQALAYWTIVGRIDQFVLGILAHHFSGRIAGRHVCMLLVAGGMWTFYWWFDQAGGFYKLPTYQSSSPVWIVMPTIEGVFYGLAIAWYDRSFSHSLSVVSRFLGSIGNYSYSIYLLHFFFVGAASNFVQSRIADISTFYRAFPFAVICFLAMVPLGYLSFRFIEAPFLRWRTRYVLD